MSDKKASQNSRYSAAIIGAGRIGATFDTPKSDDVLTHAHGYVNHNSVELIGFYDTDTKKSETAVSVWGGKSFSSLRELLKEGKPDIVSICTLDEDHVSTLDHVIGYKPKIIICEKPVTTSSVDTERIIVSSLEKKVPILVNYSRRYDTSIQELQKAILTGLYGEVLSATGIYTKGVLHNGSHMIDLARFLFGEVTKIIPLYAREDFTKADKSVAAFFEFKRCPQFNMVIGDARHYAIFELDILFEKIRLRFTDSGFTKSVQKIQEDRRYPGFKSLGLPNDEPTHLSKACEYMIDNAIGYLDGEEPLLCDIEDALKTQRVSEELSSFL